MNVFLTSSDPRVAAINLCNRHNPRMPIETLGMLSFAFPEGECSYENKRSNRHYVHPASVWARQSKDNFEWLLEHGIHQFQEYTRRYKRIHKCQEAFDWIVENYKSKLNFNQKDLTPFARCFSQFKEELDKTEPDTVKAYQKFYILDKAGFAKWPSIESIPDWWIDKSEKWVDKNFKNGEYIKR